MLFVTDLFLAYTYAFVLDPIDMNKLYSISNNMPKKEKNEGANPSTDSQEENKTNDENRKSEKLFNDSRNKMGDNNFLGFFKKDKIATAINVQIDNGNVLKASINNAKEYDSTTTLTTTASDEQDAQKAVDRFLNKQSIQSEMIKNQNTTTSIEKTVSRLGIVDAFGSNDGGSSESTIKDETKTQSIDKNGNNKLESSEKKSDDQSIFGIFSRNSENEPEKKSFDEKNTTQISKGTIEIKDEITATLLSVSTTEGGFFDIFKGENNDDSKPFWATVSSPEGDQKVLVRVKTITVVESATKLIDASSTTGKTTLLSTTNKTSSKSSTDNNIWDIFGFNNENKTSSVSKSIEPKITTSHRSQISAQTLTTTSSASNSSGFNPFADIFANLGGKPDEKTISNNSSQSVSSEFKGASISAKKEMEEKQENASDQIKSLSGIVENKENSLSKVIEEKTNMSSAKLDSISAIASEKSISASNALENKSQTFSKELKNQSNTISKLLLEKSQSISSISEEKSQMSSEIVEKGAKSLTEHIESISSTISDVLETKVRSISSDLEGQSLSIGSIQDSRSSLYASLQNSASSYAISLSSELDLQNKSIVKDFKKSIHNQDLEKQTLIKSVQTLTESMLLNQKSMSSDNISLENAIQTVSDTLNQSFSSVSDNLTSSNESLFNKISTLSNVFTESLFKIQNSVEGQNNEFVESINTLNDRYNTKMSEISVINSIFNSVQEEQKSLHSEFKNNYEACESDQFHQITDLLSKNSRELQKLKDLLEKLSEEDKNKSLKEKLAEWFEDLKRQDFKQEKFLKNSVSKDQFKDDFGSKNDIEKAISRNSLVSTKEINNESNNLFSKSDIQSNSDINENLKNHDSLKSESDLGLSNSNIKNTDLINNDNQENKSANLSDIKKEMENVHKEFNDTIKKLADKINKNVDNQSNTKKERETMEESIESARKLIKELLQSIEEANDQIFEAKKAQIEKASQKNNPKERSGLAIIADKIKEIIPGLQPSSESSKSIASTLLTTIKSSTSKNSNIEDTKSITTTSTPTNIVQLNQKTSTVKDSNGVKSLSINTARFKNNTNSSNENTIAQTTKLNLIDQILQNTFVNTSNRSSSTSDSISISEIVRTITIKANDSKKENSQNNKTIPSSSVALSDIIFTMDQHRSDILDKESQISTKDILQSYFFGSIPKDQISQPSFTSQSVTTSKSSIKDLLKLINNIPFLNSSSTTIEKTYTISDSKSSSKTITSTKENPNKSASNNPKSTKIETSTSTLFYKENDDGRSIKSIFPTLDKNENQIFVEGDFETKKNGIKNGKKFKFVGYMEPK